MSSGLALACALCLFAVGASQAPSTCGEEGTSLLQNSVHSHDSKNIIGAGGQPHDQENVISRDGLRPSAALLSNIEAAAKHLAQTHLNNTAGSDEDVQAMMDALKASLDEFELTLQNSHTEASQTVQERLMRVNNKIAEAGDVESSDAHGNLVAVVASSSEAHGLLSTASAARESACSDWLRLVESLNNRAESPRVPPCPVAGSLSVEATFVSSYDAWQDLIAEEGANINRERAACAEARTREEERTQAVAVADREAEEAEQAVEDHQGALCTAYHESTRSLLDAKEHANNQVALLQGDFESVQHARCLHSVLDRALRGDTDLENLSECDRENAYSEAADEALPLIEVEIPISEVCAPPTTTTTTTEGTMRWIISAQGASCSSACGGRARCLNDQWPSSLSAFRTMAAGLGSSISCSRVDTGTWEGNPVFQPRDGRCWWRGGASNRCDYTHGDYRRYCACSQ